MVARGRVEEGQGINANGLQSVMTLFICTCKNGQDGLESESQW